MANEKRLIDANALIAQLLCGESLKSTAESIADEKFVALLREYPTVDAVEVVNAHWIKNEDDVGWYRNVLFCSNCGCGDSTRRTKYCPHCGANMIDGGNKNG